MIRLLLLTQLFLELRLLRLRRCPFRRRLLGGACGAEREVVVCVEFAIEIALADDFPALQAVVFV
jgi:hypothetical protein